MSRREARPGRCEKIAVDNDGTAMLGCRGRDGQPMTYCGEASSYRDSALPFSEQLCVRALAKHEPHMNDAYKKVYATICYNLDETLADPHGAESSENLRLRFDVMERELAGMIDSPELTQRDNGRYLYHIDARILHAFLPAFWHRAEYGLDADMPPEIIQNAYDEIIDLLEDFSSLYENVAMQVALRRTEVEIFALQLRTKSRESFLFPTLFREDASETQTYNHDAYNIHDSRKIPVQVTNTDYKTRGGKYKSEAYSPETMIAIHQRLVNLDYRGDEKFTTWVNETPLLIEHEHDVIDSYEDFDERPRYISWGAGDVMGDDSNVFTGEYIQRFGGAKRDGLVRVLIDEAKGRRLSLDERNLLNGASHYLIAAIREKQSAIGTV